MLRLAVNSCNSFNFELQDCRWYLRHCWRGGKRAGGWDQVQCRTNTHVDDLLLQTKGKPECYDYVLVLKVGFGINKEVWDFPSIIDDSFLYYFEHGLIYPIVQTNTNKQLRKSERYYHKQIVQKSRYRCSCKTLFFVPHKLII